MFAGNGIFRTHGTNETLEEFPARPPTDVAGEFATQRRAGDRVAAVQRNVGFVRSELLSVMRHMSAAIAIDRRESHVANQPAPHPVVELAVPEQHAVRGFVHQRGKLRVGAAHEDNGEQPHRWMVDPHGCDCDGDRLQPGAEHRDGVPDIWHLAKLLAQCRAGAGIRAQPLASDRGEEARVGNHRGRNH